jgi:hypothetical protein
LLARGSAVKVSKEPPGPDLPAAQRLPVAAPFPGLIVV